MMQNKPIGFILIKRVDTAWYKLPLNTFEPYTTGEFLNYPQCWMPVYLKPENKTGKPIGYIKSLHKSCIMIDKRPVQSFIGVSPNGDIDYLDSWTPVYKHEQKNFRYALMVEGRSAPTKLHDNIEDAEKEAIRLAKKENCKVYVLKAISEFSVTQEVKKIHLL